MRWRRRTSRSSENLHKRRQTADLLVYILRSSIRKYQSSQPFMTPALTFVIRLKSNTVNISRVCHLRHILWSPQVIQQKSMRRNVLVTKYLRKDESWQVLCIYSQEKLFLHGLLSVPPISCLPLTIRVLARQRSPNRNFED